MTGVAVPAFTVRRAERRDLDALVALEEGFPGDKMSRASLARLLGRDTAEVFVVEADGEVVADAVALYRRGFRTARLYSMIVLPMWRGRGVASALLHAVENSAKERGSVSIRLEVRSDNRAAIALYKGAGYESSGTTADYYEDSSSALRMRKRFTKGGATLLSGFSPGRSALWGIAVARNFETFLMVIAIGIVIMGAVVFVDDLVEHPPPQRLVLLVGPLHAELVPLGTGRVVLAAELGLQSMLPPLAVSFASQPGGAPAGRRAGTAGHARPRRCARRRRAPAPG